MNRIIDFALKNRLLISVLAIVVFAGGYLHSRMYLLRLFRSLQLPKDLRPRKLKNM
jgi:hypothetical protein